MAREEEIIQGKKEQKIKTGQNYLFVFFMIMSLKFLLVYAFQETLKIIWKAIRL